MKTRRLTMAAAVVEFLKQQYIKRDGIEQRFINGVFGIFGHGNVAGLGQALEEFGGKELPFYQPKNEQSMVHTAIAYAKTKRGLGTFACTTSVGPGATNMITGAATATINRLPVLLLPGDIFANRTPAPVLQQLEHTQSMDISVNDCFKPVSKYWDRINRPEQILQALPEAMRILTNPELTGAVTICLPEDVQAEAYDYPENFFDKKVHTLIRRTSTVEEFQYALQLIKQAQRPLIVAGGGVLYSSAEAVLKDFVNQTSIPVALTQAGKSVLSDAHPYCLGSVGTTGTLAANAVAKDADLIITIGTRLSDFTTASKTQFQNEKVKFISININSYDAAKHGAFALIGDAREILKDLSIGLKSFKIKDAYNKEIMTLKETWKTRFQDILHTESGSGLLTQAQVIGIVNDFIDDKSTIVHAAGGLPGDLHKLWMSKSVGDYHSEYGYSCMGYEIAGSLGVKMADPQREVYAFLGDGSYLMLNHEITTSVQEGKKITVLLNDNHGYQCIHNLQKSLGAESFGNEFRERNTDKQRLEGENLQIDFIANAKSLGAITFEAKDEKSLKEALKAAKKETGTCLIYTKVDPYVGVPGFSWWDVPVAEVSGREKVKKARSGYSEATKNQKFYY